MTEKALEDKVCQLMERSASNCSTVIGSSNCFKCSFYITVEKLQEINNKG